MLCPTCPASTLVMADRSGIEIDYCPTCRGVWLDRGELDKIIERTAVAAAPAPAPVAAPMPSSPSGLPLPADRPISSAPPPRRYRDDDDDDDDDDDRRRSYDPHRSGDGYRPKKRKSLLGELFDF
jgi:uncharacterized protein